MKKYYTLLLFLSFSSLYGDITAQQESDWITRITKAPDAKTAQTILFEMYDSSDFSLSGQRSKDTMEAIEDWWPFDTLFTDYKEYKAQKKAPEKPKPDTPSDQQLQKQQIERSLRALTVTNATNAREFVLLYDAYIGLGGDASKYKKEYDEAQTLISDALKKLEKSKTPTLKFVQDLRLHLVELDQLIQQVMKDEKIKDLVQKETGTSLKTQLQLDIDRIATSLGK